MPFQWYGLIFLRAPRFLRHPAQEDADLIHPRGWIKSILLAGKFFAIWKRFLPRTLATSVHVHDHVNVHELRPRLTLGVDVVVDVHVDVIGFFIWMPLGCFVLS